MGVLILMSVPLTSILVVWPTHFVLTQLAPTTVIAILDFKEIRIYHVLILMSVQQTFMTGAGSTPTASTQLDLIIVHAIHFTKVTHTLVAQTLMSALSTPITAIPKYVKILLVGSTV
jgi:hypothetical protein